LLNDYYRSIRKGSRIHPRHRPWRRDRNRLLFVSSLIFFTLTGIFPLLNGAGFAQTEKSPGLSLREGDEQRLVGRWVRPDGGYLLEFRAVHKEGSAEAAYFNPKPVKVFQAIWTRQDGKIKILVELRDVNYPGSTYNLEYIPESDRLTGTYFQAVEKQIYAVQFVRAK
jgi:hypothetical protein